MANGHLEPGEAHAFEFCHWLDRKGLKVKVEGTTGDIGPTLLYVDKDVTLPAMNLSKVLIRLSGDQDFSPEDYAALQSVAGLLENL